MCTTHDQYICGFYPAMNIIKNAHQPCGVQTRHFIRSVPIVANLHCTTIVCFPTDLSESNLISYVLGV